jgi:hypothetical protein
MAKKRAERTGNVVAIRVTESSTPAPGNATDLTDRDIARRAFEIFCERGGQHGHDVDDGLHAERELRGSVATAVACTVAGAEFVSVTSRNPASRIV